MSDAVQLALVASIAPTVAALAGLFVSLRNSQKADETRKRVDETAHKADTIIEKAVEIHTSTNSNLSRVTGLLDVANQEIKGLKALMSSMVDAKRDVAVALATSPPPLPPRTPSSR